MRIKMSPLKLGPFAVANSGVFNNSKTAPAPPKAIPTNFRSVIDDPKSAAEASSTKMGFIVMINEERGLSVIIH